MNWLNDWLGENSLQFYQGNLIMHWAKCSNNHGIGTWNWDTEYQIMMSQYVTRDFCSKRFTICLLSFSLIHPAATFNVRKTREAAMFGDQFPLWDILTPRYRGSFNWIMAFSKLRHFTTALSVINMDFIRKAGDWIKRERYIDKKSESCNFSNFPSND